MTLRGLRPGLRSALLLAGVVVALVFCGTGQANTSCASKLLGDWRDGRIDGTYSVGCYRTALAQLPEDLRIYSSAETDLKRGLLASSKSSVTAAPKATKPTTQSAGAGGVSPLLVLAIAGAILAATGSAFALVR
jgi:hypothetical protein